MKPSESHNPGSSGEKSEGQDFVWQRLMSFGLAMIVMGYFTAFLHHRALSVLSEFELSADTLISENAIIGKIIDGKIILLKC